MSKRFPTRNNLADATQVKIAALLNENLASAIDLSLQAKQAHWNVKGPSFIALHELFDQVYAEAVAWVDTIAERAVILGGVAESTLDIVKQRTTLPDMSLDLAAGPDYVDAVARSLAAYGTHTRAAIDTADDAGDADTADLFTEVSRGVDKMLWFVEAHLHADR